MRALRVLRGGFTFAVVLPLLGLAPAVGAGTLRAAVAATWTPTEAPLPSNAAGDPYASLLKPSCPAVGACVAVGGYDTSSGGQGLIERLSGGTWTAIEAPLPSNAASNS